VSQSWTGTDPEQEVVTYRARLLELAGGGDPTHRMGETSGQLRTLVAAAGDRLQIHPAEGEWSVLELVGHIFDAELNVSTRLRWVLAEERPILYGYDQELWVKASRHNQADPDELIQRFEALRRSNMSLFTRSDPSDRERIGLHQERGEESFETLYRLIAGHDGMHLAQGYAVLAELER